MRISFAFVVGFLLGSASDVVADVAPRAECFTTCAEHDAYAQRCGCGNACMKLRLDGGAP